MQVGCLVRVLPHHPSANNLGIILELHPVQNGLDRLANVYWFDGSTYWINTALLEVV